MAAALAYFWRSYFEEVDVQQDDLLENFAELPTDDLLEMRVFRS